MTVILLFCIDEKAKDFSRKVLNWEPRFHLADTRAPLEGRPRPKAHLEDDEPLETEFIGASEEDCQVWTRQMAPAVNDILHECIVIADARSAQDDTLSVRFYFGSDVRQPYEKFEPLPPVVHVWYKYRVHYRDWYEVYVALGYGEPETVYATYFGLKDELTDDKGVFNVAEAKDLVEGKHPERIGSSIPLDFYDSDEERRLFHSSE